MIDVTIKTLDSRTRSFTVPEQITVKEFKERIASSVEIPAETQRLIFRGRVLQDDKKLNDYDVHGQTIHLVEKPPPSSRPPPSPPHPPGSQTGEGGQARDGNSFFVGAITLPAEVTEARDVQRIVQQVVSDMGEVGRNARVTSRASPDGSSVDVHINLGSINIPQVSESQQRINHIRNLLRQANLILDRLENPPQQTGTQTEPPAEDMDTTPDGSAAASEPPGAPGASSAEGASPAEGTNATEDASTTDGAAPSTGSTESSSTGSGSNGNRNQRRSDSGPTHPPASVMADVLREVNQLNSRLQPHLDRYQELLRTDPTYSTDQNSDRQEAQRLQNLTSQVLHIISHIYHSVSDCTVDLHRAPPRNLNTPNLMPSPGMAMAGPHGFGGLPLPVQVNIGPPGSTANRSGTRNTPPTTSAQQQSTTTSTSQSNSSSTPATRSSTASTANSASSPGTGRGQASSTQTQPTIQVTNSTRTFVIRPNGPGEGQNVPGGSARSFTIRGPSGLSFRAPGGASFRTAMPGNQGGPGGPGIVRGPHIQIRHVQMPGAGGQGVPLPPQVMQGLVAQLVAQAQQQAQQQADQHAQQQAQGTPPGAPTGRPTPSSTTATSASSSSSTGTSTATAGTSTATAGTSTTSSTGTSTTSSTGTSTTSSTGTSTTSSTGTSTSSTSAPTSSSAQATSAQSNTTSSSTSTSSTWSTPQNPSTSSSSTQPTFHASNTIGQHPQILLNPLLQANAWDPYLPCQSRHAALARLRGSRNLFGGQVGQPQGENRGTGARPDQQGQNEGAAPAGENAFADMIGGLVGALINQPGQFMPQPRPQGSTTGNTSAGSASNSSASTAGTSSTSHTQSFTFGPFTGFPGMRSTVTGVQSPMSEEVMSSIMSQMSRQFGVANPGGQAVNQSLSDFFRSLGYAPDPSEGMGFLNDLVNMICQNLSMPDLAAIFFGNTAPLQTMRPNMQRFVNERIMRGEAMTPGNIDVAVDRLIEETRPVITSLLQNAQTVNNIDPLASNIAFLRELLVNFITLFVGPSGSSAINHNDSQESHYHSDRTQFGDQLLRLVRTGMHEWVCLMIHMFGGREGFHDYMESLLETLLSLGDHQEMANLAVSVSLSNLETIASTMQVTEDQILQYVKKKETPKQDSDNLQTDGDGGDASKPGSSSEASKKESEKKSVEETAMEVDSTVTSTSTQSAATVAAAIPAAQPRTERNNGGAAAAVGGAMAAEPLGSGARVMPNWQAAVPVNWVPVINQDIVRQRRQAPQASLSDAYLSGMPSKRLKLTQDRNVPVSNGMETYVPETLRRAIQTAGVQPVSSMDEVMQEAKEDSQLHRACEEQVRSAVRERLRRDPDYDPQQFPNAEKYFQNKKK